ncbi:hypothetical protein VTL71DRAFT_15323 [Oculimacula yallundae]|uniref:Uncharacterized protein n=1 Tax=Oculimacula yallundae TaxID=86028 RepID=A0ABR4CGA5_9HELO
MDQCRSPMSSFPPAQHPAQPDQARPNYPARQNKPPHLAVTPDLPARPKSNAIDKLKVKMTKDKRKSKKSRLRSTPKQMNKNSPNTYVCREAFPI